MSTKLNIWILQTGEPIHLDDDNSRPMRGMNLANKLVEYGHHVNFISSVFYHQKKIHRTKYESISRVNPQLKITLIDSPGYKKNISLKRFYDHILMAFNLKKILKNSTEIPDLVFIGYPPIEISFVMSDWLRKLNIPFIVDIKDQWPDVIVDAFPSHLRFIGKLLLSPYYYMAKKIISNAAAITSMSDSFINWSVKFQNKNLTQINRVIPLVPSKNSFIEEDLIAAKIWCEDNGIRNDNKINILFVGSLSIAFDFNTIIECAEKLKNINKDVQFIICGDGEYKNLFYKKAKNLSNIIVTGWIDRNKITVIASRSKLAIAPYKNVKNFNDNIPNKIIDYISLGLPIITPLQGEVSKLISDNHIGMNYRENIESSLREVIIYLCENSQIRNKLVNNALRLYKEKYSFDHVYGNAVNLIEEVYKLKDI